jgi:two-component system response regulator FlrC
MAPMPATPAVSLVVSNPLAGAPLAGGTPASAEPGVTEGAGALGEDLRRREFQMIIDTLRAERGRRKEAAERLGISPRTLRYKLAQMRDAGMDVEAYLYAS